MADPYHDYDDGVYDGARGGDFHHGYAEYETRQDFSGNDFYQEEDFCERGYQGYQDERPGARCFQDQGFSQHQDFSEPLFCDEEDFLGESFEDQRQHLDDEYAESAFPPEQYRACERSSSRWEGPDEDCESFEEDESDFEEQGEPVSERYCERAFVQHSSRKDTLTSLTV